MITKIDDSSFSVSEPVTVSVRDLKSEIDTLTQRQLQVDSNHDEEKKRDHDTIQGEIDTLKEQLQEASDAGVGDATKLLDSTGLVDSII